MLVQRYEFCVWRSKKVREQGWRSGESTRLPQMWPGFDSRTRRYMWVEFIVGPRLCSEGFSPGSPVFLHPQKPTIQIPIRPRNIGQIATPWMCHWDSHLLFYCYFIRGKNSVCKRIRSIGFKTLVNIPVVLRVTLWFTHQSTRSQRGLEALNTFPPPPFLPLPFP